MSVEEKEVLAVDSKGAAALLGICRAHWMRLVAQGAAPQGVLLGKARRWPLAELREWIEAGCPPRERWQVMRRRKTG